MTRFQRPSRGGPPPRRGPPTKPPPAPLDTMPPQVVHEDDTILVIDKPAGWIIVRAPGSNARTLTDWVLARARRAATGRKSPKLKAINDLPAPASGLVLFAKNPDAFENLKRQFRTKRPHRIAYAIVRGHPMTAEGKACALEGTIRQPLARPQARPKRVSAVDKPAVTHYRVMRGWSDGAALRLRLETAFPGQIEDHLQYAGCEIGRKSVRGRQLRIAIHMSELAFVHPDTNETVRFHARLPEDMTEAFGDRVAERTRPEYRAPQRVNPAQPTDPAQPDEESDTPPSARPDAQPASQPIAQPRTQTSTQTVPQSPPSTEPGAPAPLAPASQHPTSIRSAAGTPRKPDKDQGWDHVAEWYDSYVGTRRSDHFDDVILPGVLRLLDPSPTDKILDVACGQGELCRALADRAELTVGLDVSPALLEAAHARDSDKIRYIQRDARAIAELDDAPFDGATCVMAIMNIDPIAPVFEGVASTLREGGRFVLVLLHPAFRQPGRSAWEWTGTGAQQVQERRIKGYLSESAREIIMNPGGASDGADPIKTTTHNRPLQSYVNALAEAGFVIDAIEEWPSLRQSEPGPRAAAENLARTEIPMFLAIRTLYNPTR